jgi:DNA-binding transcriptional ArsR family regulator
MHHMASSDALARAVGHPLRVRILAALDDGPCGLEALARRVEAEPRTTARHRRILEHAGLVGRRRAGRTTTYHLTTPLAFSDDEYGALTPASREAAVAAALAHCHTAAASALESGGFDRSDVHLSRTSIEVTEAQWRELSGEMARLLERIETLADEPAEDGQDHTSASAVLMLFERPATTSEHVPHGDAPFSATEGLERSWALSERLERELSAPATDWATVVALADQLRVLARAALNDEIRDARDVSVRTGLPAS